MKISAQRLNIICHAILSIVFIAGCSSTKEIRYEESTKEEKIEIKAPPIYKTMEARERESILNQKVSAIDRIYFISNPGGKLINKGKISTAKYDQKGFLIETITYDEKGRVQNRFEYKYDTKGLRVESIRYDSKNNINKKYTYEYDELGNKIKSIRFDLNGRLEKYYLYDYDSNLNLISDEWYDAEGDEEYKIETEYDIAGLKEKSYSYENGKLVNKFIYKYDDKKKLIEEQKFDPDDNLIGITQYLYRYR